jgi:hypothetical protein
MAEPPVTRAEPLLTPILVPTGGRSGAALPGVSRVQPLALGRIALADLRRRATATLEAFPLGGGRTVTLDFTAPPSSRRVRS